MLSEKVIVLASNSASTAIEKEKSTEGTNSNTKRNKTTTGNNEKTYNKIDNKFINIKWENVKAVTDWEHTFDGIRKCPEIIYA